MAEYKGYSAQDVEDLKLHPVMAAWKKDLMSRVQSVGRSLRIDCPPPIVVTLPAAPAPGTLIEVQVKEEPVTIIGFDLAQGPGESLQCYNTGERWKEVVTCPTTGQTIDPSTLLPIETVVDFTNIKIWE